MLEKLRSQVLEANLYLATEGLALFTFGNASGIAREEGLVVIKPSGVPYESMTPDDLVVVDLEGRTVEGTLRPSSDLATHLILYRAFTEIGGIAHTHSHAATSWALRAAGPTMVGESSPASLPDAVAGPPKAVMAAARLA